MSRDASNLPALPEDWPSLPIELHKVWDQVCEQRPDCPTRRGVYLVLAGYTYRDAAAAVGLDANSTLVEAVKRWGLRHHVNSSGRAIAQWRDIERQRLEELSGRDISNEKSGKLLVEAAISRDKIRDYEHRQREAVNTSLDILSQVGSRLADAGVSMTIELRPASAQPDTRFDGAPRASEAIEIQAQPLESEPDPAS